MATKLKAVGECVRCGNCCKFSHFFVYTKNSRGELRPRRRRKEADYEKIKPCHIYSESDGCLKHGTEEKPWVCRDWPMFPHEPAMVGCRGFTVVNEHSSPPTKPKFTL